MTIHPQPSDVTFGFENNIPLDTSPHATIGIAAEQIANGLTAVRGIGAVVLNRHIVNNEAYQSWQTVGAFALLALTDMEGKLARWGRRLQDKDENVSRPVQSYIDHLTDKGLVDGTMAAIAEREKKSGSTLYANAVATATGVTTARDVATTVDRIIADAQGIDTRAQKSGKQKALKQYVAVGFALSPLAQTAVGKTVATFGMAHTTKESLTSGWELHTSFTEQRRLRKTGLAT